MLVLCGNLNGTEELAALGQVAIQSALIQCQEQDLKDPAACLRALNSALSKLFHNYIRSDAAAIMIRKDLSASVVAIGQIAVLVSGIDKRFVGSTILLGSSKEIHIISEDIQIRSNTKISFVFAASSYGQAVNTEHVVQIKQAA